MHKQLLIALYSAPVVVCYDNDNDAYVPEQWANESLMILEESIVMSKLVHRDFEDEVRQKGDVVNTRRPAKFYTTRKTDADLVIAQDAVSENVQVPLDQHNYQTFMIKDGEGSKSFKELTTIYLKPAVQALGRGVDRGVIGQAHRFLATGPTNRVGGLGTMSSSNVRSRIVDARQKMNVLNVPEDDNRHLVVSPSSEAHMLNTDLFVKVNESGSVSALRRASLGNLFGFNLFAANNVPSITSTEADTTAGTVTNAAAAGATGSQAVSITGHEVTAGEWFTVAGNDQPVYATAATVGAGDTTAVTANEANKNATLASAVITVYEKAQAAASYAAGYSKEIAVDGWTVAPVAGRLFATGTGASRHIYTIVESRENPADSTEQFILLDRPLEAAITNNDNVFPGPAGEFNLAFHRNALALVVRPLARPRSSLGVASAVANYEGLSMRICMQYDSEAQGTRVTCDLLSGVALLDSNMGCLMLG